MNCAHRMVGLVLVAALGGCAHRGPPRGWAVSRSQHVKVYTDAWIEHEYMQEWLELSHSAYQALFPNVRTGTVDAVWLKNEPGSSLKFYSPMDDPAAGWTLETMPSGGKIGREGLIVLERREELVASGASFSMRSIRDEGLAKSQMAHLFIMKAVPQAPLWLQMGLARYMSRFRIHYKGDFALACFGSAVFDEPIRSEGRSGRRVIIPYDELTTTDWYGYDRKKRYWYEYTSYALVHYLIHGEKGFHRSRFPLFLRALGEGKSTDDALALAYPHILASEWDDRIEAHVHPREGAARIAENIYIQQGMCLKIPPVRLAEAKPKKTAADPAEIDLMLDDLVRVDPFHRHASWLPHEIVEAEAAKRPRNPRSPHVPGPGSGSEHPEDEKNPIPTIRSGTAPPPPPP